VGLTQKIGGEVKVLKDQKKCVDGWRATKKKKILSEDLPKTEREVRREDLEEGKRLISNSRKENSNVPFRHRPTGRGDTKRHYLRIGE